MGMSADATASQPEQTATAAGDGADVGQTAADGSPQPVAATDVAMAAAAEGAAMAGTGGVQGDPDAAPADAAGASKVAKPRAFKKRKVAVFLAYVGHGYAGMQRNPGQRTIESEVMEALAKADCLPHDAYAGKDPFGKVFWSRAARTDKGVSAVGQVVSAELMVDASAGGGRGEQGDEEGGEEGGEGQDASFPHVAERINKFLPEQITCLGVRRVTKTFDARTMCDRRRYEYVLPAWCFDPAQGKEHYYYSRVRQDGVAVETVNVAGDSAPAQQQQQQQVGTAGATTASVPAAADPDAAPTAANVDGAAAASGGAAVEVAAGSSIGVTGAGEANAAQAAAPPAAAADAPPAAAADAPPAAAADPPPAAAADAEAGVAASSAACMPASGASGSSGFVFDGAMVNKLNAILSDYEGTHSFHNFTIGTPAGTPQARRYMLSFRCAGAFDIQGEPWVRLVVVGQSFMLHQIRKMVALAVAIMRDVAPRGAIQAALSPRKDINVPLAPELGLFLDATLFNSYNAKWGKLHGCLGTDEYSDVVAEFKQTRLYPHIASRDREEAVNAMWLRTLNDRNYQFSTWSQMTTNKFGGDLPKGRGGRGAKRHVGGGRGRGRGRGRQQQQQQQRQPQQQDRSKRQKVAATSKALEAHIAAEWSD